jgi:prepilin-type N-terminal cleavage/methylation domain-containing protein
MPKGFAPPPRAGGFTLLEIIVVVVIIAVLAVAALSGIIRSQSQFKFRGEIKGVSNTIREARNNALANTTVPLDPEDAESEGIVAHQYGAFIDIENSQIVIFGDQPNEGEKEKLDDADYVFKTLELDADYTYETYTEGNPNIITDKLYLFYEPTTAEYHVSPPGAFDGRHTYIRIYEGDTADPDREKFIVIFEDAGNPENLSSQDLNDI